MRRFLINLAVLLLIVVALFMMFPSQIRQVIEIYGGLGILPFFIIILIIAALPRRRRNRR